MTYHGFDQKNSPRTGAWYTGEELAVRVVFAFIIGVSIGIFVLISLSMGSP